ncbi:MAG: antibiotic biosynthesis monooxygenase [Acidobacteriota bacterium]|nr:antibiotic biosynthesis monooxygenase [Acidobacteriota bacterium]
MSKQIAVIARLKAKPGLQGRLEEATKSLIEPTQKEEGCISYVLHRDLEDPTVYYFYEIWRSQEDLDRHFQTPHVRRVMEIAPEIFAEPLGLTRLEIVA